MWKINHFEIHTLQPDEHTFYLYATREGTPVPLSGWCPHLFHWHESSFYGTDIKTAPLSSITGQKDPQAEGVLLDAFETVELFGTEPFNGFIQWTFDGLSEVLFAVSPVIYEAIVEGNVQPDFSTWKSGNFRWLPPQRIWEEFEQDFWSMTLEEFINGGADGNADKADSLPLKSFTETLFHASVDAFLSRDTRMYESWLKKKKVLGEAAEKGTDLSPFFHGRRFLEWAGFQPREIPFTFGLQLKEPDEDGEMWQLTPFLKDVKNPDKIVPLPPEKRGRKRLLKRWKPYLKETVREQERIGRIIPWLYQNETEEKQTEHVTEEHPPVLLKEELTEDEAWEFLTGSGEKLLALGVEILLPSWWQALKDSSNIRLKAQVKTDSRGPSFVGLNALLDFEWRVSVNGIDLSEEEFRRLAGENRKLIQIAGKWVKLDPAFIKKMKAIMDRAEKEGMRVRDLIEQQLLYGEKEPENGPALEDDNERIFSRIQIEMHPRLKTFVRSLKDLSGLSGVETPDTFKGTLRPYQKKGMSWLYYLRHYGFGACLADDMGLGKTIQVIAYLLKVQEKHPDAGPALIICPTSVLGNWQKELGRFAPNLDVYLHYGPNREKGEKFTQRFQPGNKEEAGSADVVLTTYGLSHLDFAELSAVRWGTIVLDEAQNIKNAATKQSRAIRKLKGGHHIALTGTPMENRLTELWSIFDFINKGYLGSLARFRERFVQPIERERDREKIRELQTLIRPFLLRRTKKDEEVQLNLPDKIEQKEYCPLTVEQAGLYEQLINETFYLLPELEGMKRRGLVLKLLGMLKQLCNHPALYLKETNLDAADIIRRSEKMKKLTAIFDNIVDNGESGLIFTQYIGMGEMIQSVLEDRYEIRVPFLRGSTTKEQRDRLIREFQNGEFPVLLLSLKAGGTGLNLTRANHVIHYDRWWNPAVENQATDRVYRIGQKKFVHVHKFITTGTLEEKIDAMLEQKQSLNDEILQSDQWIADLSDDELYNILKLD